MNFRQKLIGDIRTFFKESKWQDHLHDHIVQILEMRPKYPYQYIQKKVGLKSKLDSIKHSSFITDILIYCHFVNPLLVSKTDIQNKIFYLCVEKYQHTKIRRTEAINLIQALLLISEVGDKKKEYYLKLIHQQLQAEIINVSLLAKCLYSTILYIHIKQELDELDAKLSQHNEHINMDILHKYLSAVQQNVSIMKKTKLEIEASGDLYKIISMHVIDHGED